MASSEPALPPRVFLYGSQPDLMLSGGKPTIRPVSHDNARGAAIAVKPGFEYRALRAGSGLPDDDSMAASGAKVRVHAPGDPTAQTRRFQPFPRPQSNRRVRRHAGLESTHCTLSDNYKLLSTPGPLYGSGHRWQVLRRRRLRAQGIKTRRSRQTLIRAAPCDPSISRFTNPT